MSETIFQAQRIDQIPKTVLTLNLFQIPKGMIMATQTKKQFTSRRVLATGVLTLLAMGLTVMPSLTLSSQAVAPKDRDCDDECQEQLTQARAATAQYHNESKALEDGFISTFQCVEVPGLGAMGVHYINPARLADPAVDASRPETLLYIRQNDGKMRLIGLEYVAAVRSNGAPWFGAPNNPPPVVDNPAPMLFGQTFAGPMPGHGPGEPWHYDLHVWAWRDNPRGLFFPFNSKLSCQ
jgi:hypothetical protein